MELLRHLWSVPGTRALLIVIAVETLFITLTIAWLIIQNRRDSTRREHEDAFSDTLARDFFEALDAESTESLDAWHDEAASYPEHIVRDFLHHGILRAGGRQRERLVDRYRAWGYIDRDRALLDSDSPRKRLFALRRMHSVATTEDRELLLERDADDYLERVLTAQVLARVGRAEDVIHLLADVSIPTRTMEEPLYATVEQMPREDLETVFAQRERFDEPRIRRILLEVAAERGLEPARGAALQAGDSDEVEERIGACNAAAFLDRDAARSILLDGIGDEDWRVRARAAKVLRRFPDDEVIAAITVAITDKAFWVRQNAANSLRWMGEEGLQRLNLIRDRGEDAYAADAAAQELQRYNRLSTPDQRHLSIGPRGVA